MGCGMHQMHYRLLFRIRNDNYRMLCYNFRTFCHHSTLSALEDRPGTDWFMQDGARPHRTVKDFRFLHEKFGNTIIALDYPKFTNTEIA